MDVHVRSKAPYLLEIIDHRSGGVGVARRCLGRIRKNVLHYRKLLPEAFVTKIRLSISGECTLAHWGEWRGARRECVLSVKRLFSVDVADVAHLSSVFSLNPSAAQTGEMAVLTTVSWGHCGGGGGSGIVVVEEDDGSRNFPARFGSQHPGAVLYR
ncbi:hypothetical protein G5I_11188 [Acromyrmex echinatior]|uniref:Uncharacterized protein n=1 Tax=Acromyrmex echinatior TaxID=103372 RepID=F4WYX4_ACREC|nr:hypothetical protein G5I_11188 [Acromyrmex echinatior]